MAEVDASARAPAAIPIISFFMIAVSLFCLLRPSTTDGRMPERDGAFDERHHPIEDGPRERSDCDFRPDHLHIELADLGRDAKAHADDRCTEEFGYDCADQRQSRVDLERIEDE